MDTASAEKPSMGQRVRELRLAAGLTQDDLARGCQRAGAADWKANRIGLLEAGTAAPTLQNLLVIALGLALATGEKVTLADLIPEGGEFLLSLHQSPSYGCLRDVLSGEPVNKQLMFRPLPEPEATPGWGSADDKAVSDLGLEPWYVLAAAESLWGLQLFQK